MKILKPCVALIIFCAGFASACSAESWYEAAERTSNDYRSTAGAMMREVDGTKYSPKYSASELQSAQTAIAMKNAERSAIAASRDICATGIETGRAAAIAGASAVGSNISNALQNIPSAPEMRMYAPEPQAPAQQNPIQAPPAQQHEVVQPPS